MVNRPKQVGTAAETAVVRACREYGFPLAERRALRGRDDVGDILLDVGVIIECKGGTAAKTASDTQLLAWLVETERERVNAGADCAFLVTQRAGVGVPNAHRWWAHWRLGALARLRGYPADLPVVDGAPVRMSLADALIQLRAAGYGTPLDERRGCPCAACDTGDGLWRRMNVCPDCGNKRCPKAVDHSKWRCSGSNEPGQIGVPA